MALSIKVTGQSDVVNTAFCFSVGIPNPGNPDDSSVLVYNFDPLLSLTTNLKWLYCRSGSRSVGDIFGFIGPYQHENFKVSHEPEILPYDERRDGLAYGSFFRNLQLFNSVMSGRSFSTPSSSKEKTCRHENLSGEMITRSIDVPVFRESFVWWDTIPLTESTHGVGYVSCTVNTVNPLAVSTTPTDWSHLYNQWTINIIDVLLHYESLDELQVDYGSGRLSVLTNVKHTQTRERLVISYHVRNYHFWQGWQTDWDSEMVVPFVEPPKSIVPQVGSTYTVTYTGVTTFRYSSFVTTFPVYHNPASREYVGSDNLNSVVFPMLMSQPSEPGSQEENMRIVVGANYSIDNILHNFRRNVDEDYLHIVPSSLFSTVAAFQSAEGYLGVNVLQNLAKIPGIVNSLPQIREAVSILGSLVRRDLSFSTLKEILDLATSTHLQAEFQWRPYMALMTQYLPKMIATIHDLGLPAGVVVGYGSYRKTLSLAFSRKEVTLQTRTKIVMDASPSGLLSAVLGVDALGLLPKASNLWDLIPFTFVVNWFTGVGAAIRRAEYSLLLATIPAYFVHTYTISSPFLDSELSSMKMSGSQPDFPYLRLYYRDVSHFSPAVRDSKFGFGIPTELPNSGILGSLLYQLFLS